MSCGVGVQQICRCRITHVPCHLKAEFGLSAMIAGAFHFAESGFLFVFDPGEQAVAQLPLYARLRCGRLGDRGAVLVEAKRP
jgi:hypothetical protein